MSEQREEDKHLAPLVADELERIAKHIRGSGQNFVRGISCQDMSIAPSPDEGVEGKIRHQQTINIVDYKCFDMTVTLPIQEQDWPK